ncbi:MAG: N-acetylmuramoyl-L-alanine amidase, partial [Alphaproteobacteria bacterium]|nr:N-acetylmuramoyl-L-alanine amidase [Alphaproteobacteria bacterium]
MALSVDDVRFGSYENKTRLVLDLSERADFRLFMLESPYRMVIDLPDFDWRTGAISRPAASGVKNIRQGQLQPGISRIVLDMERPVGIEAAFVLPATSGKPDRLVVDFAPRAPTAFSQEKNKTYGSLSSDASPPPPPLQTAAVSGMALPDRKPSAPLPSAVRKPIIVIDAGHGGVDPGAVGANGVFEKHVTLAMARALKKELESTGRYQVFLTRDKDVYLRLHQRVAIARAKDADLFVSLHADSFFFTDTPTTEIYT